MLVVRDADMRFEKSSMEFDDIKTSRVSRKFLQRKKIYELMRPSLYGSAKGDDAVDWSFVALKAL